MPESIRTVNCRNVLMADVSLTGGNHHYTHALCNALSDAGLQVLCIRRTGQPELRDFPVRYRTGALPPLKGKPKQGLVSRAVGMFNRSRNTAEIVGSELARLADEIEADVLHQQTLFHQYLGTEERFIEPEVWRILRRRRSRKTPVVFTVHNLMPHEPKPGDREGMQALFDSADGLIFHGERMFEEACREFKVASDRCRVIPHGHYHFLADENRAWSRREARESLGLEEEDAVVLFFGLIRRYKGLDVLVRAVAELVKRGGVPRLKLLIAGRCLEKWEDSEPAKLIEEFGLASRTVVDARFVPLDELGRYFQAADVVALPYRSGSQSGALQLAYAFKKPAVVTNVGSIGEALDPGSTAIMVEPEQPGQIADALEKLLSETERAQAMGIHGREWSAREFGWGGIASKTIEMYEQMGENL